MPVNPDVITQPQPDAKPSIKTRIISRFPRFRSGDQTPRETLEEMSNNIQPGAKGYDETQERIPEIENITQSMVSESAEDLTVSSKGNEEYASLLVELHKKNLSQTKYEALKHKIAERGRGSFDSARKDRVFTQGDRQRHQRLLELASRKNLGIQGGVKRPEQFLKMVEYIEANSMHSEDQFEIFDHEPTSQELETLKTRLEAQDYKVEDPYHLGDNPVEYSVHAHKSVPLELSGETVGVLRNIANASKDPVTSLESLSRLGIFNVEDIGYVNKKHESEKIKNMVEFLSVSRNEDVLRVIGGIGNFKKYNNNYSSDKREIYYTLSEYAKTDLSRITPEVVEKIDIITTAISNQVINFEDLVQLEALVQDREAFDFVVAVYNSGVGSLPWESEKFFKTISALKQDGLLDSLTELYSSHVSVPSRALSSGVDFYDGNAYRELQDYVRSDTVRDLLNNQDMKDFAGVVKLVTGITPGIEELNTCFDNREKISTFLKSVVTEQDKKRWAKDPWSAQTVLRGTNVFVEKGNFDVFDMPGFQQYVADFQKKYGIDFSIDNYLYAFKPIAHGFREEGKCLPIELFKLQDIVDMCDRGDIAELVEKSLSSDSQNHTDAANILDWYESRNESLDTLRTFKKYEGILGKDKVDSLMELDPWTLKSYHAGGLCTESMFQRIPQDQLSGWVDACGKVPSNVQEIIARKISVKGSVDINDIQKIKDLGDLYKGNINHLLPAFYIGGFIAESEGQVGDYIKESLPTEKFVQAVLDRRNTDLLDRLADNQSYFSFSKQHKEIINNWRSLHSQIKASIVGSDLNISEALTVFPEKYQILSKIYQYGNVMQFDDKTLEQFKNLGNDLSGLMQGDVPSKQMIELLIGAGDYSNLPNFLREDVLAQYNDTDRSVFTLWKGFPHDLRMKVISESPDFPIVQPQQFEKYEAISRLLTAANIRNINVNILDVNIDILHHVVEACGWMADQEMNSIAEMVLNNQELFLHTKTDVDFINSIVELGGVNSLSIFSDYARYIREGTITPDERNLFIDFAHIYKDPQSVKDPALRRGYKMFGDYLTIDSYKTVRSVIDGSISEEVLEGLGITQKGEEGMVQLESNMRSLMLSLTSKDFDASLLKGKVYSDFLKAYVRYEVSAWGVHSSDNFLQIIQTFKKLQETNPELVGSNMSPSGLQEVARLERPKTNDSTFTDSFLSRYATLTGNIQEALGMVNQPRSFSTLGRNIKDKIDETVLVLEQDMGKNSDNQKAQAHIQQRIDKLKAVNPADVKSFQSNFSILAQEKVFHDLLMQAVFTYTLQKFPEQKERMAEVLTTGGDPNADSISAVLNFTEHMTTKEAWASYFTDKNARRAFQNILDTKEINDGLSRLLEAGGKTNNVSLVEFVPTRGVLMEFSGYLADACWASKYQSTAESFPNITAVIMQDVSRDVPKPIGSSLLIETTATDGTPLLIIRGLNPQESYINHVDIPDFYNKYTEFVKRLAESRGRKAAIVIDTHSGGASTNRPLLYNFLSGHKGSLSQIGVSSEDTTFNGYNITNSTYLL